MIDLRNEFDDIINEFGSTFIHISKDINKRCRCVNDSYESAKDDCIVCLGTGHPVMVTKVQGRSAIAGSTLSLPASNQDGTPGKVHSEAKVFYLYHTIEVVTGDYLVKCDFDEDGLPVFTKMTQLFDVNDAVPSRGDGGRIEYTRVWTTNDPLNSRVRLSNLRKRMQNM